VTKIKRVSDLKAGIMQSTDIKIPVGPQYIQCKEFTSAGNSRNTAVVMAHGWSSSDKKYLPLGERLSDTGYNALAINLRGHGDSPYSLGDFSRQQHEQDIEAALRYIRDRHPADKIVLLGKSYSGYLSAIAAEREGVDFLILSQPALYPDQQYETPTKTLIDQDPGIFRQHDQEPGSNQAIRGFFRFSGRAFLIESENDEDTPASTTGNYLKYAPPGTASVILAGADHRLSRIEWRETYYTAVMNWLEEVIR
jgi:hypothetical protein